MGFLTGNVSDPTKLGKAGPRYRLVIEAAEYPEGCVKFNLGPFYCAGSFPSVALSARASLNVRELQPNSLDYNSLRDLGRDDHLSRTVVGGMTPVGGPSLLAVTDDEPAATGPAAKDAEPGEEAV